MKMFGWAIKSLLNQRASFAASVVGVASAFVLVLFFDAVWRGESVQIVSYIEHSNPDIWVMQSGVSNMHMASSYIWDWKADRIAEIEGVKRVTPILYLNTAIELGGVDYFGYVVGLPEGAARAGPWAISAGHAMPGAGEVVIPARFLDIAGIGIGDQVSIADSQLSVVGLSEGTYSIANPVFFMRYSDLSDILSAAGTYSYLLVDLQPDADPGQVVSRIEDEVEKVNAMTHEAFVASDFRMAMHMGVQILVVMTAIGMALAVVIVSFTAYTQVTRRQRELAIAKALGFRSRMIYLFVVYQSLVVTLLGYFMAIGCTYALVGWVPHWVPNVTLVMSSSSAVQLGASILTVAILSSLPAALRVARLDPVQVFND
ncbi:MAG: hypothetical protein CMK32_02060 [Porticoccaceae bacterium]|nr:hypothetical protein [Porticoccaceae bacterium]